MSRPWAYPLLLAVPFLAGIAVLNGLTVEIDTFHGTDARIYHLPTIELLAERLELERYPAAQTPLFHLVEALWGKLVGFELWRLRLLNVAFSYGAALVLFRLLVRRGLGARQACALALLLSLSPYFLGASFTLLTDNLAILLGLVALDRLDRFGASAELRELALGCLALGAAVLTRQSFLWLALVAAFYVLRSPLSPRERALAAASLALALAPLAALVVVWGGLVPPTADPASCGLCTDRPGVGRDALTLRTVAFTIALLGIYAVAVLGPSLVRRARERHAVGAPLSRGGVSRRGLGVAAATGALLLLISPLSYKPVEPGRGGDAGYLWKVADRLPEVAGSSLLFWVLVPLGVLALALLARRPGSGTLPKAYLAAFLMAAVPVGLVYQKYFDPFALLAVVLLVRPTDLLRPGDYAGIAALALAFVAYALSFAG